MHPKTRTLVLAVIASVILWLLGGFVFGKSIGMIFVIVGITLVGLAAGSMMDSPEPEHKNIP